MIALGAPDAFWGVLAFVLGAIVGSFLNVVVWRLPRGESLVSPARSYCPHCHRELTAYENVPLLSFLVLRARCRTCRAPISWRYFWVELLTAALFLAIYLHFRQAAYGAADTIAWCLFVACLVAAFFIDWEHYIIPDEVNAFALGVGIVRDVWGAVGHEPGHALIGGWLPRSIVGAMLCAAVFVAIQALGLLLFRKDAMGDGDVKLARAIGAMLPIGLALVSFLLAIGAGAVIGGAMLGWRSLRDGPQRTTDEEDAEEPEEEPAATPLRVLLLFGLLYVTFLDLLLPLAQALRVPGAARVVGSLESQAPLDDESEEFVAGPTHIPFGPYMVVGAVLAIFVGHPLIQWYLAWAHLG